MEELEEAADSTRSSGQLRIINLLFDLVFLLQDPACNSILSRNSWADDPAATHDSWKVSGGNIEYDLIL